MGLISKAAERFGRRGTGSPTWLVPGLAAAAAKAEGEEARQVTAAELAAQMLAEEFGEEELVGPTRYQATILRSLQNKHVYAGTVPAHVTKRRRAKNKVARKTRRLSRKRAE